MTNLVALVMLVSVNVFTPFVYAQEQQDAIQLDLETNTGLDVVVDDAENAIEPEVIIPQSELQAEDLVENPQAEEMPVAESQEQQEVSLIPMIIESINRNTPEELLETQDVVEVQATSNVSMSYQDNVVTYVDSHWNEFDMWTISITDWDTTITLLDRNLWATWTGWEDAYGYYFQWWNNYWFNSGNEPHEQWQTDAYDYGRYHPYLSGTFFKLNSNWDSSNNPDLWWGEEAYDYMRQWPCPAWYHVPTIQEWATVLEMYHDMDSKWSTLNWDFYTYSVEDVAFRAWFQNAFYIAFAGLRNNDYHLKDQWSVARFWTSIPDWNKSRRFYLDKSRVDSLSSNDRVFWYSVRCFQNSDDAVDLVTVTFDTRWGNRIQPQVLERGIDYEPATPTKWNDKFLWWYTDKNLTQSYNGYVEWNTTLYAKWRSDIVVYNDNVTTYTDTLWNEFDMWSITITHNDQSITILDRNLWARWTEWEDAYWYHFQWWNNYWFPWDEEIKTSEEYKYAGDNNRQSPYVSDEFVVGNQYWDDDANDDLWWDLEDDDYARQWPCPAWYHVPTIHERDNLIDLYSAVQYPSYGRAEPASLDLEVSDNRVQDWWYKEEFKETFNIPLANRRDYNDGKIRSLWQDARFWASTADGEWVKAGRLYLWNTDGIVETKYNERTYWYSVRCFKNVDDSNNITLSYNVNWGSKIQAQTLPKWENGYLPWYSTTREWYTFEGWYADKDLTTPFDFNSNLTKDTTIYAKRKVCWEWFIIKNNKCIPEDYAWDMDWVIEISYWDDTIYIRDRNVWADSTTAEIAENQDKIQDLQQQYCTSYMQECDLTVSCWWYMVCSDDYYKKVGELIWKDVQDDNDIDNYLKSSAWDYYFRWNNYGVSYSDLVFEDENDDTLITNIDSLVESWFNWWNLWTSEWNWWIEPNINNPCDANEWEYLPTPEDWDRLMRIWANKNGYDLDFGGWWWEGWVWSLTSIRPLQISAMNSEWWLGFSSDARNHFLRDMMIPTAWFITYNRTCSEWEDAGIDGWWAPLSICDNSASYRNGLELRTSQDENWYIWDFYWSLEYYHIDDLINWNNEYINNNVAYPVRCFVDVSLQAPEVFSITFMSWSEILDELNVVAWSKLTKQPTLPNNSKTLEWWYMDKWLTQKFDSSKPVDNDLVLYAKWVEKNSWYSGWWSSWKWWSGGGSSHWSADENTTDNKKSDEDKTIVVKPEENKPLDTTSLPKEQEVLPQANTWMNDTQPQDWWSKNGWTTVWEKAEQYTKETTEAYTWAFTEWLTKYNNIWDARMWDFLNRSEMAKITTIFATKFRWETPDENKKEFCSKYSDLWKVEEDTKEYIIQSCELWYMWYQANWVDALERFRPYTPVSVAEVSIILSRLMWWNRYAVSENKWYQWHLWAVYEHRLIDNISKPFNDITRKDAFTMLYRLSSSDILRD